MILLNYEVNFKPDNVGSGSSLHLCLSEVNRECSVPALTQMSKILLWQLIYFLGLGYPPTAYWWFVTHHHFFAKSPVVLRVY